MSNPPVASTSQLNQLITYPKADSAPPSGPVDAKKAVAPKIQVKERLYVGNLHPTVDECVFASLYPVPDHRILMSCSVLTRSVPLFYSIPG